MGDARKELSRAGHSAVSLLREEGIADEKLLSRKATQSDNEETKQEHAAGVGALCAGWRGCAMFAPELQVV